MKYLEIQGVRVPALGLGTWQLSGDACVEAVRHALELGYRHIDTAQMYRNEAEVGRGIEAADVDRDEIFLTTKLWFEDLTPDAVRSGTHRSLERLRTDYVDLLLIHWPNPSIPLEATLSAMRELQDAGRTRHIGVSNFPPGLVQEALAHGPIFCNQIEYHPFLAQDELLALAREHGHMLTAYSPLARGKVAEDATLAGIGERHGKSPVQVTLRWLMQQEPVAAIPKAASPRHREANLEIFDFELDEDEMQVISGLARGERLIDPSFAPDWGMGLAGRA